MLVLTETPLLTVESIVLGRALPKLFEVERLRVDLPIKFLSDLCQSKLGKGGGVKLIRPGAQEAG